MKKSLIALAILIVIFVVSIIVVGRVFYPNNIAKTAIDGGKKGLKTRFYNSDIDQARKSVVEVIGDLSTYGSGWKITNDKTQTSNVITAEIPVVIFTDDITITLRETENDGEVKIDAESRSRVGKSDFGENARNVRKFLIALDEKLGKPNSH